MSPQSKEYLALAIISFLLATAFFLQISWNCGIPYINYFCLSLAIYLSGLNFAFYLDDNDDHHNNHIVM